MESHTTRTVDPRDYSVFLDHLRDMLYHLPDPDQWIALNSRMAATEHDVTELRDVTAGHSGHSGGTGDEALLTKIID
ncbi:hypothetical protein E4U50_000458 [Claviceps purpurea]|nr:hypothetical protein E4U50_000458 [Claviceps purpurea]